MFVVGEFYRCKRSGNVGKCIMLLGGSSSGLAVLHDSVATAEERLRIANVSPHLDQEKINISMVRSESQVEKFSPAP